MTFCYKDKTKMNVPDWPTCCLSKQPEEREREREEERRVWACEAVWQREADE